MARDHDLLPVPPKRIPALTTREQQAQALTILIQHSAGPGHVALRAALDDALRIATGQACSMHYIRLPRRGDTRMSCQRCSWSRTLGHSPPRMSTSNSPRLRAISHAPKRGPTDARMGATGFDG